MTKDCFVYSARDCFRYSGYATRVRSFVVNTVAAIYVNVITFL